MKAFRETENVFTSARPFLVLMKILGLFPLSFEGSAEGGRWERKLRDYSYSLCKFVFWILLVIANILYSDFIESSSFIMRNIFNFSISVGFISIPLMLFSQWCKCSNVPIFLSSINDCDRKVNSKNHKLLLN